MAHKRVEIKSYADGEEYFSGRVVDLIARLQLLLLDVPAEYRDEVAIDLDSDYDTSYIRFDLYYNRPKTDEEVAEDARLRAEYAARRTQEEHQLYLSLKAKYGKSE